MLTESFINMCFSTILSKVNSVKQNNLLYKDILEVLRQNKNSKKSEVPINIKPKFDILEEICNMKMEGKSNENIIDSLSLSKKNADYIQFLHDRTLDIIDEHTSADNVNQIRIRKKLKSLYSNYDELIAVLDSIRDGSFSSIDKIVSEYENVIKKIYLSITETNKGVSLESTSSLDLVKDNFETVIEKIMSKYERGNRISTGFDVLDNNMFGGYEPSRLYMYAGASGSGKSTLMVNSLINSATKLTFVESPKKKVFVYITLENTIEESLVRMYQDLFRKTVPQVLADIRNKVDIKKRINEELSKTNSVIIMKYFKPMVTSPLDIAAALDEVCLEYGKENIKMLVIDYLDLLASDLKSDLYRMELGYITLSLKSMAVEYCIPVVTATQLNRSAFRVKSSAELNLDSIGESSKKIDHSDCIILLVKDDTDSTRVFLKIGKNRSGKSNVSIDWKVDFSISKFISGVEVSNSKQTTAVSENLLSFQGLNV